MRKKKKKKELKVKVTTVFKYFTSIKSKLFHIGEFISLLIEHVVWQFSEDIDEM